MRTTLNRLLLVDDDDATIFLNTYMVEMTGLVSNIDSASSGQKALDYLAAQESAGATGPDLIFLDLNMPRVDGWEFMEEYCSFSDAFKAGRVIIILSASPNPDDRLRAAKTPYVNEFMNKPLTVENIQIVIKKYFGIEQRSELISK